MPPTKVKVGWRVDASEAIDYFTTMERRMLNFAPVFELARETLAAANAANFTAAGLPSGGWAPLSPVTAAWKAEHGFPPNPLIRTGDLMASLSTLRGSPNEIGTHSATFGTNVEYAKFHQYGTRRMPKRQVIFEPFGFSMLMKHAVASHVIPDSGVAVSDLKDLF